MEDVQIRKTGKNVDGLVAGLIQRANDEVKEVKDTISDALLHIGRSHANMVLSSCLNYIGANLKQLGEGHRVAILVVMERVVSEEVAVIDTDIVNSLVKQATLEMVASKEIMPEWQTAASNLLVAVGRKHTNRVMEELTLHFSAGVLPHYFVILTLGKLAVANAYDMVPFINVELGKMLPMLSLAKQENIRWVFSSTISKFAESIVYYVENIDQAPDKNVNVQVFSQAFYSAFGVLFSLWLPQARENKLRASVVRALGQTSYIINKEQLADLLPKLLPAIISLYKKQSMDHLAITESLFMVLDAATQSESRSLEAQLDFTTNQLHSLLHQPLDYSKPQDIKNRNELLRCFAILNSAYSDKVVANLLLRLEQKDEKVRLSSLLILRHLINTGGIQMETKKPLIIAGLRILVTDNNRKVGKLLAQTIIAMADHGYLELDGGELMVEYIVRQCTLSTSDEPVKRQTDVDHVTPRALRVMCESVLQLIVTTIEIMEKVLWPYLLEFIVPEQYTEAFGVVCKSVAALAGKKRDSNDVDYLVDYEEEVNLPSPEALIARLFVMVGTPHNGNNRGEHVLRAMVALVPTLHQDLVAIWDPTIPKLLSKLEELDEDEYFAQKKWDDLILHFLSKSLSCVDDESWIVKVGVEFGQQLPSYNNYPKEKGFCLKCLGVVLKKATKKEFIQSHMNIMWQTVDHQSQVEQEGLAIGLGFAAGAHFDSVLTKLEQVLKYEGTKKSSGIIGFLKDKVNTGDGLADGTSRSKHTALLAYGYATICAPVSLITSRIETVILRNISPYFTQLKDPSLKLNIIHTVGLIAKSLDPLHLQNVHRFTQRPQLITYLMDCVRVESMERPIGKLRMAAFDTCSALVKLEPALTDAEVFDVVKTCLTSLLPVTGESTKKGKSETYEEQVAQDEILKSSLSSLNSLLQEFLVKQFSATGLHSVCKHLFDWMKSEKDCERERAVSIIHSLVFYYLSNISSANRSEEFSILGEIVGRLVPRCTDPTIKVREEAIMAIQAVLRVQLAYTGTMPETADRMVDALPLLKERLQKSDSTVLFGAVNDLYKVLAKKFPATTQIHQLVEVLIDGLSDSQALCSNGACVVLNGIVKLRGAELEHQVNDFLTNLHSKMPYIAVDQTTTGALRCVKSLAVHHLDNVVQSLLKWSLPYDNAVVDFWQVLAKEEALTDQLLSTFIEILKQNMPYEEKMQNSINRKEVTRKPLSIVMALRHICAVTEAKAPVTKHFHDLLAALLLKVGSYSGARPFLAASTDRQQSSSPSNVKSPPKSKPKHGQSTGINASIIIAEALQAFLELTQCDVMLESAEDADIWTKLRSEDEYVLAIENLASSLATSTQHRANVVESLRPALSSVYDADRIVATAFFGQLIKSRCGDDLTLVEVLVGCLMGRLVDDCIAVRKLCVRGLGNIADNGLDMVQRYSTSILSAMMSGMDDKDDVNDEVTTEAMTGLSKILASSINESDIRPILINIALKIRPCFEKNQVSVRAAAFRLFGDLSRFGNGPSRLPFVEQMMSNLTALLLHLNDESTEVILACKHTLKLIGPLLDADSSLNDMFQKHLKEEANLHYGEFLNDLCKIIVVDFGSQMAFFTMNNVSFFKSRWSRIRANAAMYLGFLMSSMPESSRGSTNLDHICHALLTLLADPDGVVRSRAAEAISLLRDC